MFLFFIVDTDLAHQLQEEIKFEEAGDRCEKPAFVKEFLDTNLFLVKLYLLLLYDLNGLSFYRLKIKKEATR